MVVHRIPLAPQWRHGYLKKLACSCALVLTAGTASAVEVWLITDQRFPMQPTPGARIIALDGPKRIEAELGAKLPADPIRATALIQQRLKQGGPDLQRRTASVYQDVTDAWQAGVTKVPAIVVDRRYVIYGETDVARALDRIAQHQRKQP